MRKQYFVAINFLGKWGSNQMTAMSEGLPLNSKYIKMGLEKGVSQAFKELPLVVLAMSLTIWDGLKQDEEVCGFLWSQESQRPHP